MTAGLDIEMPFRQQRAVALGDALAAGDLAEADVAARATAVVATQLRFAWVFDHHVDRSVVACAEHRALARAAAAQSIVLLRNDSLLPVEPRSATRVAVLGRLADAANLGDKGSSNVIQPDVVTPLDGVRAVFESAGAEVVHHADDTAIVDGADLVVVVVGYTAADEGEFIGSGMEEALAEVQPPMDHPEVGFPPAAPPAPATDEAAPADRLGSEEGGDRRSLRLLPADEALIAAAAAAAATGCSSS